MTEVLETPVTSETTEKRIEREVTARVFDIAEGLWLKGIDSLRCVDPANLSSINVVINLEAVSDDGRKANVKLSNLHHSSKTTTAGNIETALEEKNFRRFRGNGFFRPDEKAAHLRDMDLQGTLQEPARIEILCRMLDALTLVKDANALEVKATLSTTHPF